MLKGKRILLGITGSIAAYKSAILARLLVKNGAEVKVVMTPMAKEFITPLTMATLTKNPILVDFYNPENGDWNSHVDLGLWANAYIIAPASANSIAKMAVGAADNLLLTCYLSARCPVFIAPAMDLDMFTHPATQANISVLKNRGNIIIEPSTGELASGLEGKGRMQEPESILTQLTNQLNKKKSIDLPLKSKRILITAGPTIEKIDSVRFISNHSSGKMGYAIAEKCIELGASVTLVSGPVSLPTISNCNTVHVDSAQNMYDACMQYANDSDIFIMAAAVADYTIEQSFSKKRKKTKENWSISLSPTKDIAESIGKLKNEKQLLIIFALETDNEIENANNKMLRKNADLIVLNSLNDKGAGFGYSTNKITLIHKNNKITNFELKPKEEVAADIVHAILDIF